MALPSTILFPKVNGVQTLKSNLLRPLWGLFKPPPLVVVIDSQSGKTSGSRVAFINEKDKHIIRMHKPHPGNELKKYQIEQLIEELKARSLL